MTLLLKPNDAKPRKRKAGQKKLVKRNIAVKEGKFNKAVRKDAKITKKFVKAKGPTKRKVVKYKTDFEKGAVSKSDGRSRAAIGKAATRGKEVTRRSRAGMPPTTVVKSRTKTPTGTTRSKGVRSITNRRYKDESVLKGRGKTVRSKIKEIPDKRKRYSAYDKTSGRKVPTKGNPRFRDTKVKGKQVSRTPSTKKKSVSTHRVGSSKYNTMRTKSKAVGGKQGPRAGERDKGGKKAQRRG